VGFYEQKREKAETGKKQIYYTAAFLMAASDWLLGLSGPS
jgi:hypothetical protein